MNPEFRRQLWLQFTTNRLIVMPGLLLLMTVAALLSPADATSTALQLVGAGSFAAIVFVMGTRAAGASIVDEFREHTWDQQRMSAMQPWAMTWGKLFGATAYSWYGAAWCVLIYVPAAVYAGKADVLVGVLAAIVGGISVHALLIAVNLQLARFDGKAAQRGGLWTLFVVGSLASLLLGKVEAAHVRWWSLDLSGLQFALWSLTIFAACSLVGAWRCMADGLAVRQLPWGWPALALAMTAYVGGFPSEHDGALALGGFLISTALTYVALLAEPQPRTLWQRVLSRVGAGEWLPALQQMPRWPTTLVLAVLFAVWLFLSGQTPLTSQEMSQQAREFASLTNAPLAAVLLLLRDCALALLFGFHPRARRATGAFLLTLVVLYGVLPWIAGAMGGWVLLAIMLPLTSSGLVGIGLAALHAALALALLHWRWTTTRA